MQSYHYNNFASEARLTSFLTIAQGDAPYKHWFCLDKTLVQYKGYKGGCVRDCFDYRASLGHLLQS